VERTRIPLDRLTWARWRSAVHAFAASEVGGHARVLFAALLALLLAINGLNVVNSYVGRDFMTAIEVRSMPGFLAKALLYVGVFAVSTVAAVIYRFTEERLGLLWRGWLTHRLVARYLQDGTYYRLREDTELPNPDQRIADDVRTFTAMTLSLTLVLLNTTFTILAFSGVMWSISPLLFAAALVYAALGSGLTILFGRPLCGSTTTRPIARRACGRSWSTCGRTPSPWRSCAARAGSARAFEAAWTSWSRTPGASSR
jgi:putative ATP-binding cassette transporter